MIRIAWAGLARTSLLLSATASLACGPAAWGASPDFSGNWELGRNERATSVGGVVSGAYEVGAAGPQLKGQFAIDRKAMAEAMDAGKPYDEPTGRCIPQGTPRFWRGPYLFEIMQSAKQINIFQEYMQQTRRIYLDGRKHDPDAEPTYNGDSIGRWEGDTLVVDTVGFKDGTYLTRTGGKHSDKMHMSERLHLVGSDTLQVDATVDDPIALQKPWNFSLRLKKNDDAMVLEYVCAENNRGN